MADVDIAPSFGADLKVGSPLSCQPMYEQTMTLFAGWLQADQCVGGFWAPCCHSAAFLS